MATGRTLDRWSRIYVDGYDWSGSSRSFGPLLHSFDETDLTCIPDAVHGVLPAQATLGIGTLNGVMDNTASTGLHILASGAGVKRTVMIAIGTQGVPAQGDAVYCGEFEQKEYSAAGAYVSIPFDKTSITTASLLYNKPWGWLLHSAATAETAVNTAIGIDDIGLVSTAFGGYMMYQVLAGNGTATIKVQDAATNSNASFADLTGATSGSIDCSTPKYGVVAIGRTATVRRYLRWQIVLGTATTLTFALAFVRATY